MLQLVAKRVETLLTLEANFRHLGNCNVYPPIPPLSVLCASVTKLKTKVNNTEKEEGGPNVNEQFLLSTRMCFSSKSHFSLTVSQEFCNWL